MVKAITVLHFDYDEVEQLAEHTYVIHGSAPPNPEVARDVLRRLSSRAEVGLVLPDGTTTGVVRNFGEMSMGVLFVALEFHSTQPLIDTKLKSDGFGVEIPM